MVLVETLSLLDVLDPKEFLELYGVPKDLLYLLEGELDLIGTELALLAEEEGVFLL